MQNFSLTNMESVTVSILNKAQAFDQAALFIEDSRRQYETRLNNSLDKGNLDLANYAALLSASHIVARDLIQAQYVEVAA